MFFYFCSPIRPVALAGGRRKSSTTCGGVFGGGIHG